MRRCLHLTIGAVVLALSTLGGAIPAFAEGVTPPDDSTSTSATGAGSISIVSSDATVVGNQTSNGVNLATVAAAASKNGAAGIDRAAPGTLLSHIELSAVTSFSMLALNWLNTSGSNITLYAQTHTAAGWSEWYSFPTTGGDVTADPSGRFSTDAIWVDVSDALHVQAIGSPGSSIRGLQAVVIDTTTSANDVAKDSVSQPPLLGTLASGYLDQPAMVTRAQWGAALQKQQYCDQATYDATDIAITVHHTAGSNSYTPAQSPGIVRGIQAYHFSEQWCDIGYNFLDDKYGTIYEGRRGGADLPVHGAHATKWNAQTVGISVMMNSQTAQPSAAALSSLEQVIAWKLQNNYRDPLGKVTIAGKKLNTIFMHKDVLPTACPGKYIAAKMTTIRKAVAALMSSATPSPIEPLWLSLGGATGTLGQPFRLEQPIGDGRYTQFAKGSIYWSPDTDAHYMSTAVALAYIGAGGPTGGLGFPTDDPATDDSGVTHQDFQNGSIDYTADLGATVNFTVTLTPVPCSAVTPGQPSEIASRYTSLGGAKSWLGTASADETTIPGGCKQVYQNGVIYWTITTGAQPVKNSSAIGKKFKALGTTTSALGFPAGLEVPIKGGYQQVFQKGVIYNSKAGGAQAVYGAIGTRYKGMGATTSSLGFPTSAQVAIKGGFRQKFQKGYIYYSAKTGAQPVKTGTAIGKKYTALGAYKSYLGYPTAAAKAIKSGSQQTFLHGVIKYNKHTGKVTVIKKR